MKPITTAQIETAWEDIQVMRINGAKSVINSLLIFEKDPAEAAFLASVISDLEEITKKLTAIKVPF